MYPYSILLIKFILAIFPSAFCYQCGISHNQVWTKPQIAYGYPSAPGEWPWVVSIHFEGVLLCTGSIISPEYVLSAEHCFINTFGMFGDNPKFTVRVGSNNITKGEEILVKKVIPYDKTFIYDKFPNDIAILHVRKRLRLTFVDFFDFYTFDLVCLRKNFLTHIFEKLKFITFDTFNKEHLKTTILIFCST